MSQNYPTWRVRRYWDIHKPGLSDSGWELLPREVHAQYFQARGSVKSSGTEIKKEVIRSALKAQHLYVIFVQERGNPTHEWEKWTIP